MRKSERRFYRLLGISTLQSVALLAILPVILSVFESPLECQPYSCRGIDVKMEMPAFRRFINSIKENNGVLVLGTSETDASFYEKNYPGILNRYFSAEQKFSSFAGAGRACYIYFPVIVNNPELFRGLKVMYFINPTYWRNDLNAFNKEYFMRYNEISLAIYNKDIMIERGIYKDFVEPVVEEVPADTSYFKLNEVFWLRIKEPYVDLLNRMFEDEHLQECVYSKNLKEIDSSVIKQQFKTIIPEFNISPEYAEIHLSKFVKIDPSDFQYKALTEFIKLCNDYEIDITFFLGPYNAVYCKRFNEDWMPAYEEVLEKIRRILNENNQEWIDGSDLSYIPGTFKDLQHHSDYASWLIADKIAKHYEKHP